VHSDRYLKFILTIISICLVYLCLRPWLGGDFVTPASAQEQGAQAPVRVVIAGIEGVNQPSSWPAGIPVYVIGSASGPGSVPVNLDLGANSVPVNVVSSVPLGVNVVNQYPLAVSVQ
jgi:hypothetical protein